MAVLLTVIHDIIITKMKISDNFYVEMGDLLCCYADQAGITYVEVCDELHMSSKTYSRV